MKLRVRTDIPCGNACDVSLEEVMHGDATYTVTFAADPHGGPECLWFCFRIEQMDPKGASDAGEPTPPGKIRLVLKNMQNMLGATDGAKMRPVIRYAGEDWRRLPAGLTETLPDGRQEVAWLLDSPKTWADVAFCYPYTQVELDSLLKETKGYWKRDVIGVSQSARPIIRLSNAYGEVGSGRPGVYLIARQHSGETPGSWVLDGFLRYVGSTSVQTPLVWAVPLSNIDGVEQGDYGKDNFPYDLNRAWGKVPMRHETLVIQRDLHRWKARCRPVLALDFHAPGAGESSGIYAYLPAPECYPREHEAALVWADRIAELLTPEFADKNFARVARYASRWQTPTFATYAREVLGACGISLETPYALVGETVLTRERYREAGARIAKAVLTGCLEDVRAEMG